MNAMFHGCAIQENDIFKVYNEFIETKVKCKRDRKKNPQRRQTSQMARPRILTVSERKQIQVFYRKPNFHHNMLGKS